MSFTVSATATGVIQALARADLLPSRTVVQTAMYRTGGSTMVAYPVTAGKTLYVTTMTVGVVLSGSGFVFVGDNCTALPATEVAQTDSIPLTFNAAEPFNQVITFASPMKFTHSVRAKSSVNFTQFSLGVIGWEE